LLPDPAGSTAEKRATDDLLRIANSLARKRSAAQQPAYDPQAPLSPSAGTSGWQRPRRMPRQILLPLVTQMALEGRSGQEIARQVGWPQRTINQWLQELRQEWTAKAAEGAGPLLGIAQARLDAVYREAMEAWRESQKDVQVRVLEESSATGKSGCSERKKSVWRTVPQRRNASLLTAAIAAVKTACLVKGRAAQTRTQFAGLDPAVVPLEALTDNDWRQMSIDQRREFDARLEATTARIRRAVVAGTTKEDVNYMNRKDILGMQLRIMEQVEEVLRDFIAGTGPTVEPDDAEKQDAEPQVADNGTTQP
jgi:hypothetical protein